MSKRKLQNFARKQAIKQYSQDFSGYRKTRDAFMGGATPSIYNQTDEIEAALQRGRNINARDIRYRKVR